MRMPVQTATTIVKTDDGKGGTSKKVISTCINSYGKYECELDFSAVLQKRSICESDCSTNNLRKKI